MQSENEENLPEKISSLRSKWKQVSPTTREQLEQMVADLKELNRFIASQEIKSSSQTSSETKLLETWHIGLNRFTEGRFDQVLRSDQQLAAKVEVIRAVEKRHEAALSRLERNDFALKLDLDEVWLESGGKEGCPNFSMLVACFNDALTPKQVATVETHFDHCDQCAERFNADPSLSGYFPSYDILK
ncbi:MAG: hypothetical protein Aurels2KO_57210 [Aureliella sp.]